MLIAVLCPSCGKRSNAPDSTLGKRAKCGKCGTSFIVAEAPPKAPPIATAVKTSGSLSEPKQPPQSDIDDLLGSFPSANAAPDPHELDELLGIVASTPAAPKTKACPMCGETILEAARKCKHCGELIDSQSLVQANKSKGKKGKGGDKRKTDPLAIVCFATGMLSLLILPIVFAPICYITAIVSYYRLRENPDLKGRWLRITGAICGALSILYLFYQFEIGPFANRQSELPDEPAAQVVARRAALSQQRPVTQPSNDVAPQVTAAPAPTVDWIEEADKQLEDGENEKAAEAFGEAIKADPKSTKAVNGRGVAFLRLRKLGRALDDFTRAIELDPTEPKFYSNRAIVFNDREKYTRALADLTKAIELSPKNPQWYDERGSVYYNMDDEERAKADWAVAKRLGSLTANEKKTPPPLPQVHDSNAPRIEAPPLNPSGSSKGRSTDFGPFAAEMRKLASDEFVFMDAQNKVFHARFDQRTLEVERLIRITLGRNTVAHPPKYDFDTQRVSLQLCLFLEHWDRRETVPEDTDSCVLVTEFALDEPTARRWRDAYEQGQFVVDIWFSLRKVTKKSWHETPVYTNGRFFHDIVFEVETLGYETP